MTYNVFGWTLNLAQSNQLQGVIFWLVLIVHTHKGMARLS